MRDKMTRLFKNFYINNLCSNARALINKVFHLSEGAGISFSMLSNRWSSLMQSGDCLGRLWNLCVKRFLKIVDMLIFYPETDFMEKFSGVRVFEIMQGKRWLNISYEGSATPSSGKAIRTVNKLFLSSKSVVVGSIPTRLLYCL